MEKNKCESLSIIIPCYNEEGNIEKCINQIPQMPWKTEIIIVNDGSADRTKEVAVNIKEPNVKVVSYEKNRGKGYAVRMGLKYAKGDVSIILDADMATPPEEIPIVVKPIFEGKADFVNTSRLIYPMEEGAMKKLHIPGNKMFALFVSLIIRKRITDSLSGFKAFKTNLFADRLKEDSWPDFELLIKASRLGLKIIEVPIHYKARTHGQSKMKTIKHGYNMFLMLFKSLIK